ncbi:MAG: serine hydrolase, partial [Planctomycetia bacterium]
MSRRPSFLSAVALVCCVASSSSAAADGLEDVLIPIVKATPGRIAVAADLLGGDDDYFHEADLPLPTASLIKAAVLVEAYRQAAEKKISLAEVVTLKAEDKVPGSGVLTPHFSPGATLPLFDAVHLMIAFSDNTATNLVVDRVGIKSVNETTARLGLPHTRLHSKVYRRDTSVDVERSKKFGLGSTTARETAGLFAMVYEGKLGDAAATKAMLAHLAACEDRGLAKTLPRAVKIYQKTGAVGGVRTAGAVLVTPRGPVALGVLLDEHPDKSFADGHPAEQTIAEIGAAVYKYFSPPEPKEPSEEPLKAGATGALVVELQRALNDKLKPSPELSTDGDFGPATVAALQRFQRDNKLPVADFVDPAAWKALGPIKPSIEPAPAVTP